MTKRTLPARAPLVQSPCQALQLQQQQLVLQVTITHQTQTQSPKACSGASAAAASKQQLLFTLPLLCTAPQLQQRLLQPYTVNKSLQQVPAMVALCGPLTQTTGTTALRPAQRWGRHPSLLQGQGRAARPALWEGA